MGALGRKKPHSLDGGYLGQARKFPLQFLAAIAQIGDRSFAAAQDRLRHRVGDIPRLVSRSHASSCCGACDQTALGIGSASNHQDFTKCFFRPGARLGTRRHDRARF